MKQNYDANLNQVDFRTAAEPARLEINGWVSDHTSNRIKDLLVPGVVELRTRLVLVNAIYFKGKWLTPFKPANTTNALFNVTLDKTITAAFMHATERFGYAETPDLQILELHYAGGRLSMMVILPRKTDGLSTVESSLNAEELDRWAGQLSPGKGAVQRVNVYLPKFRLTSQFSLGSTLAEMGLTDAFSPRADFSGMDGAHDLYLPRWSTRLLWKSTKRARKRLPPRLPASRRWPSCGPIRSRSSGADHPFLFLIRDVETGRALFLGRVNDPAG